VTLILAVSTYLSIVVLETCTADRFIRRQILDLGDLCIAV